MRNRLHNAGNPFQGKFKRVLCVCSAGLLRSPTAALVLSQEPFNYNTRAAGIESYALVLVDAVLLEWADEVVCMTRQHRDLLMLQYPEFEYGCVRVLNIPDDYEYRDPDLMKMIRERYGLSENASAPAA